MKWLSCLGLYFFSRQGGKRVTVGDASNRSIEKGTLEQIIVIDASFPPCLYIYLSIYLSLSPCERHTCSNLPGFKILFAVVPLTLAIPSLTLSLSLALSFSLSPCESHTCSNLPGFKILFAVVPLTLAIR